jgi:hypothetical protein
MGLLLFAAISLLFHHTQRELVPPTLCCAHQPTINPPSPPYTDASRVNAIIHRHRLPSQVSPSCPSYTQPAGGADPRTYIHRATHPSTQPTDHKYKYRRGAPFPGIRHIHTTHQSTNQRIASSPTLGQLHAQHHCHSRGAWCRSSSHR